MLENRQRGLLEFADQVSGRRDVEDVVITQFLALQLQEMVMERAVERCLLVRVFAVAERLRLLVREAERIGKTRQRRQIRLGLLRLEIASEAGFSNAAMTVS